MEHCKEKINLKMQIWIKKIIKSKWGAKRDRITVQNNSIKTKSIHIKALQTPSSNPTKSHGSHYHILISLRFNSHSKQWDSLITFQNFLPYNKAFQTNSPKLKSQSRSHIMKASRHGVMTASGAQLLARQQPRKSQWPHKIQWTGQRANKIPRGHYQGKFVALAKWLARG